MRHMTKEEAALKFSIFLQDALERKHWTQYALARAMGVTHGQVSHWHNAKRVPSPRSCRRIAEAMDLDPDVVLHAAGHRAPAIPLDEESPGGTIMALVHRIDWLRDEAVYELVRGMLTGIVETQDL